MILNFQVLEVKSPNDRLSNKQILWIEHLRGLGVDAAVCHVEAVGGKRIANAATAAASAGAGGETTAESDLKTRPKRRKRRRDSGDDFL